VDDSHFHAEPFPCSVLHVRPIYPYTPEQPVCSGRTLVDRYTAAVTASGAFVEAASDHTPALDSARGIELEVGVEAEVDTEPAEHAHTILEARRSYSHP
jgi:hypothetical protein